MEAIDRLEPKDPSIAPRMFALQRAVVDHIEAYNKYVMPKLRTRPDQLEMGRRGIPPVAGAVRGAAAPDVDAHEQAGQHRLGRGRQAPRLRLVAFRVGGATSARCRFRAVLPVRF